MYVQNHLVEGYRETGYLQCQTITRSFLTAKEKLHLYIGKTSQTQDNLSLCLLCISRLVVSDSLRPCGLESTRLLCPWDSPGKNTGVGCHALLQGIIPNQGSNPRLLHWQVNYLPFEQSGKSSGMIQIEILIVWLLGNVKPQSKQAVRCFKFIGHRGRS